MRTKAGFTLIELLVVVAIIALLISILLPSLAHAREQGKKAVCLSNLRSVAQSMAGYSSEDEAENAIPIQQQMVTAGYYSNSGSIPGGGGSSPYWALRTVIPFMYGGRNAQVPFQTSNALQNPNGRWASRTRPLNKYIYDLEGSDENDLPIYRCPSDQGYPDTIFTFDCPDYMFGIPCYDFLGNSYRFNFAGIFFPAGTGSSGEICVGPWGHRLSTLENPGRQTAIMEPLFYTMTIQAVYGPVPRELLVNGWHRNVLTSNIGMVDGSARPARVEELTRFDSRYYADMNFTYGNPDAFFRRGPDWQMDCYPTPAAWLPKFNSNGSQATANPSGQPGYTGWPFTGCQENMRWTGN
jgi:prepilin-type N-terminal cleavage/methylation domain-containing protein